MKYDAYAFMKFLAENSSRVCDSPSVSVDVLVNGGMDRLEWKRWLYGCTTVPTHGDFMCKADDLPARLFDLSLTHDMSGWRFDQNRDSITGFTIYLIPAKEHSTSITPEFIDALYTLAAKGDVSPNATEGS